MIHSDGSTSLQPPGPCIQVGELNGLANASIRHYLVPAHSVLGLYAFGLYPLASRTLDESRAEYDHEPLHKVLGRGELAEHARQRLLAGVVKPGLWAPQWNMALGAGEDGAEFAGGTEGGLDQPAEGLQGGEDEEGQSQGRIGDGVGVGVRIGVVLGGGGRL